MSPEGLGCRVLVSEANGEGLNCERLLSHCKCTFEGNWRSRPLPLLLAPDGYFPKPPPQPRRTRDPQTQRQWYQDLQDSAYMNLSHLQVIFAPDIFPLVKQKHH